MRASTAFKMMIYIGKTTTSNDQFEFENRLKIPPAANTAKVQPFSSCGFAKAWSIKGTAAIPSANILR
jgi:hypothetical protein